MFNLYVVDLLTGWKILPALKEITKTERDTHALDEIIEKRKLQLFQRVSIIFNSKIDNDSDFKSLPFTDKFFFKTNEKTINSKEKFLEKKTGGSTGVPFKYRVSKDCQGFLWASIIRSLMQVGYKAGNKVAFLAGSSVLGSGFSKYIFYKLMNIIPFNSFGMSDDVLYKYVDELKKKNIKYLYGYSNAIYFLAKFIEKNNLELSLDGIVCTAEQLHDDSKEYISRVLNAKVIRQYGVNDGGISAFECGENTGYHVITNRSFIEVVEKNIISTDLINKAQIFSRYSVGDRGTLTSEACSCGLVYPRIESLLGRSNDMIKDESNNTFHSEIFTHFFRCMDGVQQWQVISDSPILQINIHLDNDEYMNSIEKQVKEYFNDKMIFTQIDVVFNRDFELSQNGKLKFVVQR